MTMFGCKLKIMAALYDNTLDKQANGTTGAEDAGDLPLLGNTRGNAIYFG